jgi:hypothetical protein
MNTVFEEFTRYINEWSNGQAGRIKPDDITRAVAYASMRLREEWGEELAEIGLEPEKLAKLTAMMRRAAIEASGK